MGADLVMTTDILSARPVGVIIGDPAGIGPEVVVKALMDPEIRHTRRPLLLGSVDAVARAVEETGAPIAVRAIRDAADAQFESGIIDVLDTGDLQSGGYVRGQDNVSCGLASGIWIDQADALARKGVLGAVVLAPISAVAMKLAGTVDRVIDDVMGENFLMLVAGPLKVLHVSDHVPLRELCAGLNADLVFAAIRTLSDNLAQWGQPNPRIAVCGLNPHAMGAEEQDHIAPAIARAQSAGIDAFGPVSPDAAFRQCVEGRHDVVVAMYHDQGHIAVKTWGFSGNLTISLGARPYPFLSVAHGTAYDIVGKGVADPAMMINAMRCAQSFARGEGFPKERPE